MEVTFLEYLSEKSSKEISTEIGRWLQKTTARTWKQPKCPSTEEWIKKMWYIYTMEYYSAIKKNEVRPFAATWMDLEGIALSEISQRKTNIV